MRIPKRILVLASLTFGGLVAACDTTTDTEASAPFDAGAALSDYEALEQALSSEGLAGFQMLTGRTPLGSLGPSRSGAARSPIISDFHRGATFVYDPEEDEYVVDRSRPGAPATGVRFVLYEIDAHGFPLVDQETGYADLVDEGDTSREDIVLHVGVVQHGVTMLDYRVALDETGTGGTLSVGGFLVDDGPRLDFAIEATGVDHGVRSSVDVSFDLGIHARDFEVSGSVRGEEGEPEGEGEIHVFARHRDESFRVDVIGDDGMIDGSVELNGELFATVSGPADDPTFLGASGAPLTGLEFLVLWHVVDSAEDVFDLLEDLLDPVDELVFLGAVL